MWKAGPTPRAPEAGRAQALRLGFTLRPGMKVGLYGGSFNPPHAGHAHVADTGLRRLGLDRVIWLVSPQNPLKSSRETEPLRRRLGRARRFTHGPAMILSDVEARLGSRFTVDTVSLLKARFPGVRFVWLMGSDGMGDMHRWRDWPRLMRSIPMAVIARPPRDLKSRFAPAPRRFAHARVPAGAVSGLAGRTAPAWAYLSGPLNYDSSTALRLKRANKNPG